MNEATGKNPDYAASLMPRIDGRTRLIGIVADPIEHVRTPQALNALLAARGVNAVVVPIHVRPTELTQAVRAFSRVENMAGLLVTIPYKESIVGLCGELTPAARQVGSVNVVRFTHDSHATMIGTNLDGEGFVGGLRAQGHQLAGRKVFLAGAGGAGKAIAHAVAAQGIDSIGIYNRDNQRALQLVQELKRCYPALRAFTTPQIPSAFDLAINATSLGLAEDDPAPFPVYALPSDAIVAEAVMKVELTPLLAAARQRGLVVHYGRHMLASQIERMGQFLGLL